MRKAWQTISLTLAGMSLLILAACGGANGSDGATGAGGNDATAGQAATQRVIKAGIGLNEDHPEGQGLLKFKEIVEQKTGGKIKVETYFAAQLGDDQQMTEALKAGTLEVTVPSTSPLVGTVKEFGIFDFPFLFNSGEEADAILDGPIGQKILEKLPEHNLVGLSYWENGFRNLTNNQHPVAKLEDFQGLKIRTMQNEVHLDAFQALGANPTPMAFSEVFTALEGKTVDGQENPLATILSNKYYEVQDYLSMTRHVYTPFAFLISKSFWDQLTPEEQTIIREASIEAGKYQRELSRKADQEALDALTKEGMKVNELSDAEKERIKQVIQPVIDKYSEQFGRDLVDQLNQQLAEIRKQ
ncbi:TRAP transporter substrate-binding protein [Brevibacillus fulvus]|uniref:Tripartite ATP-independent transporter DctP family solute receptor n=1 Tax=Brevibacillus fulvus TaxID=1125967 RepID=A0A939BTM0_9BACL|nr:TRAP transporter substrate-binding protein [Brevibacillus fulvus]MBM7589609.1 tripartite ATP-independent transporter DctP family solute receptor [Brevibacillus fulvus]